MTIRKYNTLEAIQGGQSTKRELFETLFHILLEFLKTNKLKLYTYFINKQIRTYNFVIIYNQNYLHGI